MNWKWRALAGALLLAGTIIWLPRAVSTSAEARYNPASTVVRGPALDNGDNGAEDNNSGDNGSSNNNNNNDNKNSNNNNNDNSGGNSNNNDNSGNGNNPPPPNTNPPPNNPGQNGALTVKLEVSGNFKPVVNTPFQITVTGSGAPIDQLIWWADGGGPNAGPNNDDLAHVGTSTFACNGANPCSSTWTVQARNTGFYTVHAQARDTSGNVAQIDSQFLVSENPRN